jgi:hypothetical protein
MEQPNKTEPSYEVAATVAHDLNEELTVILNSVAHTIETLETDDPAYPLMAEVLASVQRCSWRASKLLNFCASKGHVSGKLMAQRPKKDQPRSR